MWRRELLIPGVRIRAVRWQYLVVSALFGWNFLKFAIAFGSLRKNIFDKLHCRLLNNLIQKHIFVMQCSHTSCQQTYSKRCTYHMHEMETWDALSKTFFNEVTFYPTGKNLFKVGFKGFWPLLLILFSWPWV